MKLVVASLLLVGCGFNSVAGDMKSPGSDLSGLPDGAPGAGDMAVPPGSDLSVGGCQGCGCGGPALLVAVGSVNGATSNDGRVLQLALAAGGAAPTQCGKQLTGNKTLPKSPTAIGWVAPNLVAFGAQEGVFLIDSIKDTFKWTYQDPRHDIPRALFPLQRGSDVVLGVGYDTTGYNSITQLYILDLKMGTKLFNWDLTDAQNSPIVIGSQVPSMTQSPLDPGHIIYVDNGGMEYPAADVAVPYDGAMVKPKTYYMNRPPGPWLKTINSVRVSSGGGKRTAWLQSTNTASMADAVYFVNDDGTGPLFTGPLGCSNAACLQPFKASDAVPDPTSANAVITTCVSAASSNVRHVVRFDDSGTCTVLVDGSTLATLTYPVALAIVEAR